MVPRARGQRRPRLDPLGAVGVSGRLALALVPLTLGRDEGWPVWTWVSLAAALPVLAATVAWERRLTRRGGEPLLDLALFRDRAFSAGLLLNFVAIFFFGSFMFVLTLLLQSGLGLSPLHAGIVNLPLALTFIAMTLPRPAGGRPPWTAIDHPGRGLRHARRHRARPHRHARRRSAHRMGHRAWPPP